jgi:NhaP-type Na+/H+ or K+/H+ antiporter
LFASILSCTDTIAVLALLKEVGAPTRFRCLVEGESLFNDGACLVLLEIAIQLTKGRQMTLTEVIILFC